MKGMLAIAAALLSACESSPQVTRPTPSTDPVVGLYTLTVRADSDCAVIPEVARHRNYTARFDSTGANRYVVTVSDATFLTNVQLSERSFQANCILLGNLGCNQFTASYDGDVVRIHMIADHPDGFDNGGQITEQIAPGIWLVVWGSGPGRLSGSRIEASLEGGLRYWPESASAFSPVGSVSCNTSNLRLTFARK
jgi:hypothetical protein